MDIFTIIAIVFGVITMILAVKAFFDTPVNQRYKLPKTNKQEGVEYAPEYTLEEKVKKTAIPFICVLALFLLLNFFLIPKTKDNPDFFCESFLSIQIYHWFGFVLFVPIILFIYTMIILGKEMLQVISEQQYPLPGQKVYRPTKVLKGAKAKFYAYFKLFMAVVVTLTVSV